MLPFLLAAGTAGHWLPVHLSIDLLDDKKLLSVLVATQAAAGEQTRQARQKPLRTMSDPATLALSKPPAVVEASADEPASPKKYALLAHGKHVEYGRQHRPSMYTPHSILFSGPGRPLTAADGQRICCNRAAIARLANLRNLRRIPVSSSAPNSPATSTASGPLAQHPSSSLRRTGSADQPASTSAALQDVRSSAPQRTGSSGLQSSTLETAGSLAPKKPARTKGAQRPVQPSKGVGRVSGEATPAGWSGEGNTPGGKSADGLELCEGCGRTFNAAALEKHSRICAKVGSAAAPYRHPFTLPYLTFIERRDDGCHQRLANRT